MTEEVIYVDFCLAGDVIFSCQLNWFVKKGDIELKRMELADFNEVETSLIIIGMKVVKHKISLPDNYMKEFIGNNGIVFRDNKL